MAMKMISQQDNVEFLDISYCKKVTDEGMLPFGNKELPISALVINGVTGVTSAGVSALISCCMKTLVDYEGSNLDQEGFKSDALIKLGQCWNLETFDISGCRNIDDQALVNMQKAEV